jgi:uncharacterized repeat protein (TIGR01451 family)
MSQNRPHRTVLVLLAACLTLSFALLSAPAAMAQSGSADLAVTLSAPASANPGDTIDYTATVTNNGPDAAPYATFSVPLPGHGTLASFTPPSGWTCSVVGGITYPSGCVHTGSFASGQSATFVFAYTFDVAGSAGWHLGITAGVYDWSGDPSNGVLDPVSSNNNPSVTVVINKPVDLSVTDTAAPNPVLRGHQFTYSLTAQNSGPSDIGGTGGASASLTDVLPAGVTFISAPGFCTYYSSPRIVSCNLGSVAAGASIPVAVVVRADSAGPRRQCERQHQQLRLRLH